MVHLVDRRLPNGLKLRLRHLYYRMATAAENNRLTKVVSTKLSIEDYDSFRITVRILCKSGLIKHGTSSELLRRVILDIV